MKETRTVFQISVDWDISMTTIDRHQIFDKGNVAWSTMDALLEKTENLGWQDHDCTKRLKPLVTQGEYGFVNRSDCGIGMSKRYRPGCYAAKWEFFR